jgi:small subunit ribosomal protein S12
MSTLNQISRQNRSFRIKKNKRPALNKCPQKFGLVWKAYKMTPRKPNSATRSVVRIKIIKTKVLLTAYIPGIGHKLTKYSTILFRGGRTQDLPGLKYKVIRGKHDLAPVIGRRTSRSKYGIKRFIQK